MIQNKIIEVHSVNEVGGWFQIDATISCKERNKRETFLISKVGWEVSEKRGYVIGF